jgi:transposase, IS5 family
MRKRFEQQIEIGTIPISEVKIILKKRDSVSPFLVALQKIYLTPEYNDRIFSILEDWLVKGKSKTGRPGMDLWQIFVLAQFRLSLNISYDDLYNMANNHYNLRQILGIEKGFGHVRHEIGYQNIIDNVGLLNDQMVKELNAVIVEFGHDVFKKKATEVLRLKTDSFVVESNVHFPTDYNLLWDCARKCLDTVSFFLEKYPDIAGWRKINNWYSEAKSMMRTLGKASAGGKDKEKRVKIAAQTYLQKTLALTQKIEQSKNELPLIDNSDLLQLLSLERFLELLKKHIDLVNRRLIKGETIPQQEKMFSIFEQYTEWVTKGKLHPNVELGKKVAITTDQFGLIIDYRVMDNEADSEIVLKVADKILEKYKIGSWSFDKGFWHKDNWSLLSGCVDKLVMPKKGKRTLAEEAEETDQKFKRLKMKHSAVESNINELEHCGLDRCPDRGFDHFKRYVGLAVTAYNLKRIGRKLWEYQKQAA